MDHIKWIFVASLFLKAVVSVRVFLEDDQTDVVFKEVPRGSSVTLQCRFEKTTVGETQQPNVEWSFGSTHYVYNSAVVPKQRNGIEFVPPGNLVVHDLKSNDTGVYTCRVVIIGDDPSLGTGKYNLTVLVPPHPNISCGFPMDLDLTIGRSASFQCREKVPEAVPAPKYIWYKGNTPLPTNSSLSSTYRNSSFHYNRDDGRLIFTKVVEEDEGLYYCSVENKVGMASCTAQNITTTSGTSQTEQHYPVFMCSLLTIWGIYFDQSGRWR